MEKKSNKKLDIMIIILAIIAISIVIYGFYHNNRTTSSTLSNSNNQATSKNTTNNSSKVPDEIDIILKEKASNSVALMGTYIAETYKPTFQYFMSANKEYYDINNKFYTIEYMVHDKINSTYSFLDFNYDKNSLDLIGIKYVVTDIKASHKLSTDMSIFLAMSSAMSQLFFYSSDLEDVYYDICKNISDIDTLYLKTIYFSKDYNCSGYNISVILDTNLILSISK